MWPLPLHLLRLSRGCNAREASVVPESGGEFCHVPPPGTRTEHLRRFVCSSASHQHRASTPLPPPIPAVSCTISATSWHKVRMVRTAQPVRLHDLAETSY